MWTKVTGLCMLRHPVFSFFPILLYRAHLFTTSWIARHSVGIWGKNTEVSQDSIKNRMIFLKSGSAACPSSPHRCLPWQVLGQRPLLAGNWVLEEVSPTLWSSHPCLVAPGTHRPWDMSYALMHALTLSQVLGLFAATSCRSALLSRVYREVFDEGGSEVRV